MHTRVEDFCKSQGWRFAPVQFTDAKKASNWKFHWKVQVRPSTQTRDAVEVIIWIISLG